MKPIKLTESEKLDILRLHNSSIIIEQSTGKTIADIQKLVGANPDNKLGPKTLAAIKTKLGQPDKVTTTPTTTTSSTETTKTELPMSLKFFSALISFSLSRWCKPIEGSSRMYKTFTNCEPIWVANLMRCASPPDSDLEILSKFKYSNPTSNKNPILDLISLSISDAIVFCLSEIPFSIPPRSILSQSCPPSDTGACSLLRDVLI